MTTTVFDVLGKQILEQVQIAEAHLHNGVPSNYADYREAVGVIKGLKVTLMIMKDLEKQVTESDDD